MPIALNYPNICKNWSIQIARYCYYKCSFNECPGESAECPVVVALNRYLCNEKQVVYSQLSALSTQHSTLMDSLFILVKFSDRIYSREYKFTQSNNNCPTSS